MDIGKITSISTGNVSIPLGKTDYREYELSRRQLLVFVIAGYMCIFAVFFMFFRSLILSGAAGLSIYFLIPYYRSHLASSRRSQLTKEFRDLLTILSASIESGRQMEESLVDAYETMGTIYDEDTPIMKELRQMRKGILENHESDIRLLSDFADRSGCEDIRSFVQVYLACRNTGGDVNRIITHTSKIMSDKMEIAEQIAVLTAQKKLEGRMISVMPFAMILALNIFSPSYVSVLYDTLAGRGIMAICLGSIIAGIGMMEKLTNSDDQEG